MAHCTIKFEIIPRFEEWKYDQFTNWLHPLHGPSPDNLLTVYSGLDHYVVAVWFDRRERYITTALECPTKPVGRGSILWSARWRRTEEGDFENPKTHEIVARGYDNYRNVEEFYRDFIPAVIQEAETAPLGSATQGRRQIIMDGVWVE